jgi:hypothetical protein
LDSISIPAAYAPTKTGSIEGITCYATSLVLEADTAIRLYFDATSAAWEGTTVAVDVVGATYHVERVNNRYVCIEITGIHAADLDTTYTVTLTRGQERITIRYSGLSYAWAVLNGSTGETLCQMVKGLYRYWQAAESYSQLPPEIGDDEFEILPIPPADEPTEPPVEDYEGPKNYEEYLALSYEEQTRFMNSFPSVNDFMAWLRLAREEYEAEKDKTEIGDDGIVDLG